MLITFSDASDMAGPIANANLEDIVWDATHNARAPDPDIKWTRGLEVRFTLPGATTAQHESVILALLELDPRATIRTSRALYKGLADYQRQNKPTMYACPFCGTDNPMTAEWCEHCKAG